MIQLLIGVIQLLIGVIQLLIGVIQLLIGVTQLLIGVQVPAAVALPRGLSQPHVRLHGRVLARDTSTPASLQAGAQQMQRRHFISSLFLTFFSISRSSEVGSLGVFYIPDFTKEKPGVPCQKQKNFSLQQHNKKCKNVRKSKHLRKNAILTYSF